MNRVPVDRLRVGDQVRAVRNGPVGTVARVDERYGWTLVNYQTNYRTSQISYKHGQDNLGLVAAASDESETS